MTHPDDRTELERVLIGNVQPKLDEIKIGELLAQDELSVKEELEQIPHVLQAGDVVGLDCRCHDGNCVVDDPMLNIGGYIMLQLLSEDKGGRWPVRLEHVVYEPDLTKAIKSMEDAREALIRQGEHSFTVYALEQGIRDILRVEIR